MPLLPAVDHTLPQDVAIGQLVLPVVVGIIEAAEDQLISLEGLALLGGFFGRRQVHERRNGPKVRCRRSRGWKGTTAGKRTIGRSGVLSTDKPFLVKGSRFRSHMTTCLALAQVPCVAN